VPEFEVITKIDAVKRQIESAIDMFMEDRDLLSVNTLTMSSLQLLYEYFDTKKIPNPFKDLIKPEKRGEVIFIFNKTYNFSKHAKTDADEKEKFYFEAVKGHLLEAIELFKIVNGNLTAKMESYKTWFLLYNPDLILGSEKIRQQYKDVAKEFDLIEDKKLLLETGIKHFERTR
jgi:hypothetical protein